MTLTRTSPAMGGSTVMVSSVSGSLGARATMALQVIGFPAVSDDMMMMRALRVGVRGGYVS